MKNTSLSLLSVIGGAIIFNFLFWEEKLGLNLLLYAVFFVAILWLLFPQSRLSRSFIVTAFGAIFSALMVLWHNSAAAKLSTLVALMCSAGFAQEPQIRFVLNALGQYLTGWLQTPRHFYEALNTNDQKSNAKGISWSKKMGLTVVPFMVVAVFYLLYYAANEKFALWADRFWAQVGRIFTFDISWPHLVFWIFGFFVAGAAFWKNQSGIAKDDLTSSDELHRIRPPKNRYIESRFMMGLKREFQQDLILLWMLNGLLLLVNLTDITYVWFGFDTEALQDLKGYVHEGTYFLISSILLAMAVLFYTFRSNINFYPANAKLKTAAYIWLAQNAILALSVGVRNARYIEYHGLAYKRIGVVLFLILVFYGLVTLYQKIKFTKTAMWIWRKNAWALFALMVINSSIAWDVFITRYNLSGAAKGAIDVQFMIFEVSMKNLHVLESQIDALPGLNMYPQMTESEIRDGVQKKRLIFERHMQVLTWKSLNFGDLANAPK
ncbi:MAG: DUF4173 domain-containing protein [Saprospiraceae bacterium]|nr:DUF4173 domain-containing protein [Saprospiraceae bacterium]